MLINYNVMMFGCQSLGDTMNEVNIGRSTLVGHQVWQRYGNGLLTKKNQHVESSLVDLLQC